LDVSKIISPILGIFGVIASFIPGLQPLGIIALGAKIGVDYLSSRHNVKPGVVAPVSIQAPPPPFSMTVENPVVPRMICYGCVKNPGASFWKEAGPAKANLTYGLYMCDGPISLLMSITCDDELVPWTAGSSYVSPASSNPSALWVPNSGIKWIGWNNGGGAYSGSLVMIEAVNATDAGFRSYLLGTLQVSGTFNLINIGDSGMANFWDATHLARGMTVFYAYAYFGYTGQITINSVRQQVYPNNWPIYNFVFRGAPVYDPRDKAQSELNPMTGLYDLYNPTWVWSENPALIAADYINRLIQSGQTAIKAIDWASIAEAADDCDRLVPCKIKDFGDGSGFSYEPFARMTGNVSLDLEPRDVLAKIMAISDGSYGVDSAGRFQMWIGKVETPNVVLDDSDVIQLDEEFGPTLADEINYVNITYTEPRQSYNPVQAPLFRDEVSIARIGRRTSPPIQLDFCPSPSQAWRMVRRHVLRQNRKRVIRATLGPRGIMIAGQRVVGLACAQFNIVGNYRVSKLVAGRDLREWQAELIEVTSDIFDDPAPPNDPVRDFLTVRAPAVPTPTNADLTVVNSAVRIDWSQKKPITTANFYPQTLLLVDPNYIWDARYSTDNGSTWTQVNIQISQFTVQTPAFAPGTTVIVQTRFISQSGTLGAWSASSSPITI
jgi:hypothetical protein